MTDEPSARDIALDIARQIAEKWVSGKLHFLAIPAITSCIESALLSHGQRERARGMRDGADVCKELTMATLLLALGEMTAQERRTTRAVVAYCAICIEHRARSR